MIESAATVVAAVVHLGHVLGHAIVAEGVETAEQAETLRRLGCDFVQGFYFAPPLAEAHAQLLAEGSETFAPFRPSGDKLRAAWPRVSWGGSAFGEYVDSPLSICMGKDL